MQTTTAGRVPAPIVDTHAHVFDRRLPLAPARRYAPDYDAPLETYLHHLDTHGIGAGVLVQPSFLGSDNRFLVDAIQRDPARLRGVAVVSPEVADDELESLNSRGVTGLRLNLVGHPAPDLGAARWISLWPRLAKLGWHVELHREAKDLASLLRQLLEYGLRVVVDHFGRPDPALGVDDPGFRALLAMADSRKVWVKVSAAYRCADPGTRFMRDATEAVLAHFGSGRVMWGSDWPHTQFEQQVDYRSALAALRGLDLAPALLDDILRSTPAAFYGFKGLPLETSAPRGQSARTH